MQEGVWLRRFLEHLINKGDTIELVLVNCDSQATIAYTKDPKTHKYQIQLCERHGDTKGRKHEVHNNTRDGRRSLYEAHT